MHRPRAAASPIAAARFAVALLGVALLGAIASPALAADDLPEWRPLWDFSDPTATEGRFRKLLAALPEDAPVGYGLIVRTQLARTLGLQGRFEAAHAVLDAVEAELTAETREARVRCLLERGRTLNSSGHSEEAKPLFTLAHEVAGAAGLEGLALDALHMIAIVVPLAEQPAWNVRAIAIAEASKDPRVRGWLGPLYHNQGVTQLELGETRSALDWFLKDYAHRLLNGERSSIRIAKWCVALALRKLGRLEPALRMQREMLVECEETGDEDGFVQEEIAECLWNRGDREEARPYFARAHERLRNIRWVAEGEPERLARLRRLADGEEE